ncbi:MAG: CHAD domain-containing protein [Nevskia sp.]|nr:CHAD domain-containing protein [Nevskia sp.]
MDARAGAAARHPRAAGRQPRPPAAGTLFRQIFAALAAQVVAGVETADRSGSADAIHQLRIDITRLRTALSAFAGFLPDHRAQRLGNELKWLMHGLAATREWDVFLAEQNLTPRFPRHGTSAAAAAACRAQALEQARAVFHSHRCGALLTRLRAMHGHPGAASVLPPRTSHHAGDSLRPAASVVLRQRLREVRQRGRHLRGLRRKELHRLRMSLKRLRYASEMLEPLYAHRRVQPYLTALSELQGRLGVIQDAASGRALASQLKRRLGKHRVAAVDRHGAGSGKQRKLRHAWHSFRRLEPFWET